MHLTIHSEENTVWNVPWVHIFLEHNNPVGKVADVREIQSGIRREPRLHFYAFGVGVLARADGNPNT